MDSLGREIWNRLNKEIIMDKIRALSNLLGLATSDGQTAVDFLRKFVSNPEKLKGVIMPPIPEGYIESVLSEYDESGEPPENLQNSPKKQPEATLTLCNPFVSKPEKLNGVIMPPIPEGYIESVLSEYDESGAPPENLQNSPKKQPEATLTLCNLQSDSPAPLLKQRVYYVKSDAVENRDSKPRSLKRSIDSVMPDVVKAMVPASCSKPHLVHLPLSAANLPSHISRLLVKNKAVYSLSTPSRTSSATPLSSNIFGGQLDRDSKARSSRKPHIDFLTPGVVKANDHPRPETYFSPLRFIPIPLVPPASCNVSGGQLDRDSKARSSKPHIDFLVKVNGHTPCPEPNLLPRNLLTPSPPMPPESYVSGGHLVNGHTPCPEPNLLARNLLTPSPSPPMPPESYVSGGHLANDHSPCPETYFMPPKEVLTPAQPQPTPPASCNVSGGQLSTSPPKSSDQIEFYGDIFQIFDQPLPASSSATSTEIVPSPAQASSGCDEEFMDLTPPETPFLVTDPFLSSCITSPSSDPPRAEEIFTWNEMNLVDVDRLFQQYSRGMDEIRRDKVAVNQYCRARKQRKKTRRQPRRQPRRRSSSATSSFVPSLDPVSSRLKGELCDSVDIDRLFQQYSRLMDETRRDEVAVQQYCQARKRRKTMIPLPSDAVSFDIITSASFYNEWDLDLQEDSSFQDDKESRLTGLHDVDTFGFNFDDYSTDEKRGAYDIGQADDAFFGFDLPEIDGDLIAVSPAEAFGLTVVQETPKGYRAPSASPSYTADHDHCYSIVTKPGDPEKSPLAIASAESQSEVSSSEEEVDVITIPEPKEQFLAVVPNQEARTRNTRGRRGRGRTKHVVMAQIAVPKSQKVPVQRIQVRGARSSRQKNSSNLCYADDDSVKRKEHNHSERQRRRDQQTLLQNLRKCVPELENVEKAPKVRILDSATLYIKDLNSNFLVFDSQIQALEQQRNDLIIKKSELLSACKKTKKSKKKSYVRRNKL